MTPLVFPSIPSVMLSVAELQPRPRLRERHPQSMSNQKEPRLMTIATLTAARALLAADPPQTDKERQQILQALGMPVAEPKIDRLMRTAEVAKALGVHRKSVENYKKRGLLVPLVLPGQTKALGYRTSVVEAFIAGRFASPTGVPA